MADATKDRPYRRVSQITLGEHRGSPRIYLQGKYLLKAGFSPAEMIEADFQDDRVVVRLDPAGTRTVSSKKGEIPIIDITNQGLLEVFGDERALEVRITEGTITVLRARTERAKHARVRNGREGSAFSGGGLLSEAARQAGLDPAFAIETEPEYAAVFEANHPGARMFQMPVEQVRSADLDDEPVEVLTMGIPCQPFSNAWRNTDGRSRRDRAAAPESHDLGHMTFWALRLVEAANPWSVVIENVPGYLESGAYHILRGALSAMGYSVDARVLSPLDFGGFTDRRRAVVLAHTGDRILWPEPTARGDRTLGEILEPVDGVEWFTPETKAWLYRHWKRQTAKGNGFASQVVTSGSTHVGTIKKGYTKEQGDNPVVAHPERADTHRWFTLKELRRLHDLPDDYRLGGSRRLAGEIIGQGVDVGMFRQVIGSLTGRRPGITGDELDQRLAGTKAESRAEAVGQLALRV